MDTRIIRSHKRFKTVQAREVDGVLEIRAPASMSDGELQPVIARLQLRIARHRAAENLEDSFLERRAANLNRRLFQGQLTWKSIRWAVNQTRRYGSCAPGCGDIRISHRLAKVPRFVLDYVIVHELAHLLEPNHGPRFWALVNRYPRTERARGYLMAVGREDVQQQPGL
jgi:predicted metal-dependent hydrolase